MITGIVTTEVNEGDDTPISLLILPSAVNVFNVQAWSRSTRIKRFSTVVETGRNTGVFEAEFLIADTEGANDGAAVAAERWFF